MNQNLIILIRSTLIKNIKDFIQSLTLIDIVFFFSVLLLMILVVILLYFIKINEDHVEEVNMDIPQDNDINVSNVTNSYNEVPTAPSYIGTYLPENSEETVINNSNENINNNLQSSYYEEYNDEEPELLDLKAITKALENNEVSEFDLSSFEEEQEREAIISYEELLNKARNNNYNNKPVNNNSGVYTATSRTNKTVVAPKLPDTSIPYKNELMFDDLTVREVDLDSIINEQEELSKTTSKPTTLSYEEEEAFLETLKSLQKMIN